MFKIRNILSNRALSLLIKVLIVSLSFWFLYSKVFHNTEIDQIRVYYLGIYHHGGANWFIVLAVLLMPLNWGLETWKWQFLARKIESLSFFQAFRAVLSGITVSLAGFNRIGEFAGRILYLDRSDRVMGILLSVLGSIGQLLITLLMGGIALLFFIDQFMDTTNTPSYFFPMTALFVLLILAMLIMLFLHSQVVTIILKKIRIPEKYHKYMEVFSLFKTWELGQVLGISWIRYLVFTIQFYILLLLAQVDVSFLDCLIMVPMIFLTMTAVPSLGLTEIATRGSVTVYFLGMVSENDLGILTASFLLWVINIAMPSLMGGLFIFGVRIFRSAKTS